MENKMSEGKEKARAACAVCVCVLLLGSEGAKVDKNLRPLHKREDIQHITMMDVDINSPWWDEAELSLRS